MFLSRATRFEIHDETGAIALDAHAGEERIELLGELGDWINARRIERATRIEAPVGVYAYKLRVDGQWMLDAANERTRSREGRRDNVLSIGGAPEPILFAPVAPFVIEADRGGLLVTAALRRSAGDSLTVRWSEGDAEARAPMRLAADEDEHRVFRARLPVSTNRVRLAFELASGAIVGREDGAPFVWTRARAAERAPEWWRTARVYTILVDRFRPAVDHGSWGEDPGADCPAGGHLEGIRRSLDELAALGIDTLYLTPIHLGASCHRYDVIDPLRVDPALGGEEAFARLVEAVHARGMRILVDFSFSHAGRGFPAFEDVLAHGRASRFAAWFQWQGTSLAHYGARTDAPLFDLDGADVRALVIDAAERWARRGVDGLRLDAAAEFPLDLAREVRVRVRAIRPEAIVLGEVVPAHAWRWRAAGAIDASTDFTFHQVIQDLFARRTIDVIAALRRLDAGEIARGGPSASALRFASTHDHPRLATLARAVGNAALVPLAWAMILTWPGVPAVLYGEEIGMSAAVVEHALEGVWDDRAPMPWRPDARDDAMHETMRALLVARRSSEALATGELEVLHAETALLVYRRTAGDDVVDVAIHLGDEPIGLELGDDERPEIEPIARVGIAEAARSMIHLGPRSAIVLRRLRSPLATRAAIVRNARAADAEFALGVQALRSWPSRLDFALTERCNLRCAHCITVAPERTESGTARSLALWLLDRLREAMTYASYFGFVHGGESLVAPLFFDVLDRIARARAGAPYVVHLLTNGVRLTAKTTRRLIDAGVNSIAVSLDGAHAATNDAIRLGGRFDAIVANVAAAAQIRREMKADLRLGLSLVVTRENAGELGAFADLAASLGVDWIKLEEMVPATPVARRSLITLESGRARDAVAAACARAESLGLVAVDHTRTRALWRCQLDPDAAAFLRADEHANRSRIHPCRAAWEHACIEPNGDVKLGDFYGPTIGSLADDPLGAIWSSPLAQAIRARAPAERLCGRGPVTCVTPT